MLRLVYLLALLCYAYATEKIEDMEAGLIVVHRFVRDSFRLQGRRLAPLKYSTELANLARVWVDTCSMSRPNDCRFANLGSSAIAFPITTSLVYGWATRLFVEEMAYDPVTGECSISNCMHYVKIVQPATTKFGCAVRLCFMGMPRPMFYHLSVCLYQAEKQSVPIQQTSSSTTITTTWRPTTTIRTPTTTTTAATTISTTRKTTTTSATTRRPTTADTSTTTTTTPTTTTATNRPTTTATSTTTRRSTIIPTTTTTTTTPTATADTSTTTTTTPTATAATSTITTTTPTTSTTTRTTTAATTTITATSKPATFSTISTTNRPTTSATSTTTITTLTTTTTTTTTRRPTTTTTTTATTTSDSTTPATLITPKESTTEMVKLSTSTESPPTNNGTEMEEAEDKEDVQIVEKEVDEEEYRPKKISDAAKLSSHLLFFGGIAIAILI
ncbi:glioma patholocus tagsis protein [Echinococcus multilocularis]|uniref:Glioma patholocus tagsis protein n=1 Tax=Echinococcus multilocularis TaxID=6211 RepID=A0A068YNG9_ECHMU|nr:glioma patholocus tagsis protein [Echinococcus multilocularis]